MLLQRHSNHSSPRFGAGLELPSRFAESAFVDNLQTIQFLGGIDASSVGRLDTHLYSRAADLQKMDSKSMELVL